MDAIDPKAQSISRSRVWIDGGRWVSIRPIERTDAAGLSDFYARLSPESTRRRFLCGLRPSFAALRRDVLGPTPPGFVGILVERGPNDGAVVAHASVQADGHGGAEVAFAVADELQGRGIGRALMALVVGHARRRGLRSLTATLLLENGPMRRLLRGSGASVISDEIDAGTEEISLAI